MTVSSRSGATTSKGRAYNFCFFFCFFESRKRHINLDVRLPKSEETDAKIEAAELEHHSISVNLAH
jgi:hypothetical protein